MANEQTTAPVAQLTLKDLVAIHEAEFPNQASEVLTSYLEDILENADEEHKNKLDALLLDEEYKEKFYEAITYTAFIIFVLLKKVLGGNDNFVSYLKEYLMSIRGDDEEVRAMRLYFMGIYSQKAVLVELLGISEEVAELFAAEVIDLSNKYKKLLGIV